MASFKVNSAGLFAQAKLGVARNILAATMFFRMHLEAKLSERTPATRTIKKGRKRHRIFVPPFSKEGEYPMLRIGNLRNNIKHEPTKAADVVSNGLRVRVGYGANAFYGAVLEFKMKRLGLMHTMKVLEPQLSALTTMKIVIRP